MLVLLLGTLGVGLLGVGTLVGRVIRDTVRRQGDWGINVRKTHCPRCGQPAPVVRIPQNARQATWGGWTCKHCGTEMDKWGRNVDEPRGGQGAGR